jgi:hypothetical protein
MQVMAFELESGMMVIDSNGKGVLTVESVRKLPLFRPQYEVRFHGIKNPKTYNYDVVFELLPQEGK